jgi:hypothetical protein
MTSKEFTTTVVEPRLELIRKVLSAKGVEYGADKSAFHTFQQACKLSFHKTPQGVAWEFMCKHLQSIKDMIDDRQQFGTVPPKALVEEKIGDTINYLILLEGMFQEDINYTETPIGVNTTTTYDKIKYTTDGTK